MSTGDVTLNGTVGWRQNGLNFAGDNCCIPWDWDRCYRYYQPIYTSCVYSPSKLEQAFKITSKLLEKGIIKELKLKQFIELVNEISGLL